MDEFRDPARSDESLSPRSNMSLRADGVVLLNHHVVASDDFELAAAAVFSLLKLAQRRYPGALRDLTITIDGHQGERAGYDPDFFEFQQEFILGAMGQHFTWIQMPLTGSLANPETQQDAAADRLRVDGGAHSNAS